MKKLAHSVADRVVNSAPGLLVQALLAPDDKAARALFADARGMIRGRLQRWGIIPVPQTF